MSSTLQISRVKIRINLNANSFFFFNISLKKLGVHVKGVAEIIYLGLKRGLLQRSKRVRIHPCLVPANTETIRTLVYIDIC